MSKVRRRARQRKPPDAALDAHDFSWLASRSATPTRPAAGNLRDSLLMVLAAMSGGVVYSAGRPMEGVCRLVGIAGPAGAGKSEAARALVEYYGYVGIGFADPIRATVLALYPHWGPAHLEDRALKDAVDPEYGISPRQALEIVGDHGRRIDPSGYVRLAQERVLRAAREAKERGDGRARVVFFDVRKSEESRWIRAWGGAMAFVERPGVAYARTHATSSPVTRLAADVVIRNDGDLDDLRGRMGEVFGG